MICLYSNWLNDLDIIVNCYSPLKSENIRLKNAMNEIEELNRRLQLKLLQSPPKVEMPHTRFEPISNDSSPVFILKNGMEPKVENVSILK